jgi:D-alanyl-D-alanine carboxypeptidase
MNNNHDKTEEEPLRVSINASKSEAMYKLPVAQQIGVLAILLIAIFGTTVTPKILTFMQKSEATASLMPFVSSAQNEEETATEQEEPFSDIRITAQSAYVWDLNNQKALYKKDESTQLPLASLTKLMTALLAQEILDEDDTVTIDALSIKQDGDSGLREGEVFNRLSLSDMVLMSSSNDGAFALASAAGKILTPNSDGPTTFVHAMNIRTKEIGLSDTYIKNPTGLDLSLNEAGAFGTARDMAFLMEYIVENEPEILSFTTDGAMRVYDEGGSFVDAENTNYYVRQIPGLIGSKTGFTDLAGGNLVIAFNAGLNRPIVAVVLGSTQQERFTDVLKLVEETEKYVALETLPE